MAKENAMTGTYPDSNEDIAFWSDVKSVSRGHYPEEEMAVLTADKNGVYKTSPSGRNSDTALVKWEPPKRRSSYNFNEVAINLQNTAGKALEDSADAGSRGHKQNSISRGVARIVLEESNNIVDSSREYITGVVRKVARYAQDTGHDGESSGSAANQVIQPEVSLWRFWRLT